MSRTKTNEILPPIIVDCPNHSLDSLLGKEWLLANRIGAYSSSTVVGCNTRRYHGLLVAATTPPMGRIVALSAVLEQLMVAQTTYDLSTHEFPGSFCPRGHVHLAEFRAGATAVSILRAGAVELTKEVVLASAANAVTLRYTVRGQAAMLCLRPFIALRDFHDLRQAHEGQQVSFETSRRGIVVYDRRQGIHPLHLTVVGGAFQVDPQWWYRFHYRVDLARGQDASEDLYTPGTFAFELNDGQSCQLTASLGEPPAFDVESTLQRRRTRRKELAESVAAHPDATTRRLAGATDAFVVERSFPNTSPSKSILAGYHWFADWGRDTFIALPGLLLTTRRFALAKKVFGTFASHLANGIIPNRFDDYGAAAHYNSIDASLWFIVAAERYLAATGDLDFWRNTLISAAQAILSAYQKGTLFDIRADEDGLLAGGSDETQLTWMDACLGNEAVTPRHGKAVEVNALWHCAHCIMAKRCAGIDDELTKQYEARADLIAQAFVKTFWNDHNNCLYDSVTDDGPDDSIRPNQILAVSLPYSPLSHRQQAAVVRMVTEELLTPYGLRTLSPKDPRYRRKYGGSWESRDRAYHQGTVWAWLIGPFIEAYLAVHGAKPPTLAKAGEWLAAFDEHLHQAGLGYISEIFDGDPPHTPRGCIAQAWSVAEVLRAKHLVATAMKEP